ncbi:MAG: NUDIX hydrolase [Brevefilum sp.]
MATLSKLPVRNKVYAYIRREKFQKAQLLVFEHVDFPEAGVQVPGGTVEYGEEFSIAALREAEEETGLRGLCLKSRLGSVCRDMSGFGFNEVHHRHYYLLSCPDCEKEEWIAFEESPSDGSEGPIAFWFYWIDVDAVPPLLGGMEEMVSRLG